MTKNILTKINSYGDKVQIRPVRNLCFILKAVETQGVSTYTLSQIKRSLIVTRNFKTENKDVALALQEIVKLVENNLHFFELKVS